MADGLPIKSVWGKKAHGASQEHQRQSPPIVVSFEEVMSEELANKLQEEDLLEFDEDQRAIEASLREMDEDDITAGDFALALQLSQDPDCSVDAQMALELQRQFDREAEIEHQLQQSNEVKPGKKKLVIGTDRFEISKAEHQLEKEPEEEDTDEEREAATDQLYRTNVKKAFPPCGYIKKKDGTVITKHDKEIGQRRNCQKMMLFPANFNSGDIIEERLSSRIYNDLQMFSKKEEKYGAKLKDKEEKATSEAAVDAKTRLILLKWINNADLDRVEGIIAIGKESAVLHGIADATTVGTSVQEPIDERHFAVKVHKQTLNAFRNRSEYVRDDIRFKNPRSVLKIWCEKEYLNLQRLHRAAIPCPAPVQYKKHVLLMSLIQSGAGRPAPKLKNVVWATDEEKLDTFEQIRKIMKKMYEECRLVHGDLSEFNLLYADGTVYVIDMAQAVDLSHHRCLAFLYRDIENILNFYEKNATEGLPTTHELFTEITSIKFDPEKDLLSQIEAYQLQNLNIHSSKFRSQPGNYELVLADKEKDALLDRQYMEALAESSDEDEE